MSDLTRRLLAASASLLLLTGAAGCSAEVDEDGANLEVEETD